MKKIILPVLGLAAAVAFSPVASADAAVMHHKHPVHHHKIHHVVHHKKHYIVHHKKVVHHKKHVSAPKY